jgi:uncharacterized protein YraI
MVSSAYLIVTISGARVFSSSTYILKSIGLITLVVGRYSKNRKYRGISLRKYRKILPGGSFGTTGFGMRLRFLRYL